MTLKESLERVDALRAGVKTVFDEAGPDMDMTKVTCLEGDTKGKVEKLQAKMAELDEAKSEYDSLAKLDADRKRVGGWGTTLGKEESPQKEDETKPELKSLGEAFMASKAGSERKGAEVFVPGIDLKTTMQASAGFDPFADRIPRIVDYAMRPLVVTDFIPKYTTGRDTIKYMKVTTRTNSAAEASEGGNYGEAALAATEYSDEVEKISVWLPITDEQLEDVEGLGGWVNAQLMRMVLERLDSQVLQGDGTSPNLWGAANIASVQTQAKGSDPTPDAFHKAITAVRVTGRAEPNVIFMHPNDWQSVRLLRTADGIYIFGSPQEAGVPRLWGVPVAATSACTENTGLVGDWAGYSGLFIKRGLSFKVTDSHASLFIAGTQAIRCDMRCAMVYLRDEAFCTVTGI